MGKESGRFSGIASAPFFTSFFVINANWRGRSAITQWLVIVHRWDQWALFTWKKIVCCLRALWATVSLSCVLRWPMNEPSIWPHFFSPNPSWFYWVVCFLAFGSPGEINCYIPICPTRRLSNWIVGGVNFSLDGILNVGKLEFEREIKIYQYNLI